MVEAAGTSETSVNLCHTTPLSSPDDSHLDSHCLENLKSHSVKYVKETGYLFSCSREEL
jgi:hypothetical protein